MFRQYKHLFMLGSPVLLASFSLMSPNFTTAPNLKLSDSLLHPCVLCCVRLQRGDLRLSLPSHPGFNQPDVGTTWL